MVNELRGGSGSRHVSGGNWYPNDLPEELQVAESNHVTDLGLDTFGDGSDLVSALFRQ